MEHCEHHQVKTDTAATAATVTLHCLAGCSIGEFIGLAIGVEFGLSVAATITLATVLAFITGFALTLYPLVYRRGMTVALAFKTVWIGEVISIGVMEIAMNVTDYLVGGMSAASIFDAIFWIGFAAALVAGYIFAYPVNYVMVKRNMPRCH